LIWGITVTYILSCVTEDVVYQVSDRRFTSFEPPHGIVEESNKAVLYENRMVFGYSGISHVGAARTDEWLAGVVSAQPTGDLQGFLLAIAQQATAAFRQMLMPNEKKRHAFSVVGWIPMNDGDKNFGERPFMAAIHNALGEGGQWKAEADEQFTASITAFPRPLKRGCRVTGIGANIPKTLERANRDCVRNACGRRPSSPADVLRTLAVAVRRISEVQGKDATVGKKLNGVSLPRKAIEVSTQQGQILVPFVGAPTPEHASCCYFDNKEALTLYAPIFVVRGGVMTNISIHMTRFIIHSGGEGSHRMYLASDGAWVKEREKAHRFDDEEKTKQVVAANACATGYEVLSDFPLRPPAKIM
jgi:hypothetical protein